MSSNPSDSDSFDTEINAASADARTIAFGPGEGGSPGSGTGAGSVEPAMLEALATLPGYKIEQKLGQGGMGAVFRATQTALNRRVAIKVLPEHLCNNPKYVARLSREAMVLAKINHANVVGCIDMGEHRGLRYVVMEFIEGDSLGGLIDKRKHVPVQEALYYIKQAVVGLDHAHALGIIHRDIKPDNMLLAKQSQLGTTVRMKAGYQLKIADLGLASFTGETTENTRLTHEGATIGSPHYMSPEQTLGQGDLDFRTDIYALGVTLYHMLTGETPYPAPTVAAVLARKLSEPMKDPRESRPEIPASVSLLIQKMTAREKGDRYSSYGELLEDIEAAEQGTALKAQIMAPPRASLVLREDTIASLRRLGQRSAVQPSRTPAGADAKSGSAAMLIVAGVVLAAGIGGAALFITRGDGRNASPTPPKDDSKTAEAPVKNTPPKTGDPSGNAPPRVAAFSPQTPLIENRSTQGWAATDSNAFGVSDDGALFLQKIGNTWVAASRSLPSSEFMLRGFLQTPRGADECEVRVGIGAEYVAVGIRFPKDAPRVSAYIERRRSADDSVIDTVGSRDGLNPDEWRDLRVQVWDGLATCFVDGKLLGTADITADGSAPAKAAIAVRNGIGTFRALEISPRPEAK